MALKEFLTKSETRAGDQEVREIKAAKR